MKYPDKEFSLSVTDTGWFRLDFKQHMPDGSIKEGCWIMSKADKRRLSKALLTKLAK